LSEDVKILVCDDSMLIRTQVQNVLTGAGGYEIFHTTNGEEAVKTYQKEKPDVVLLDLVMPEVGGLECLKQLKEVDKEARVIIMTSSGTKENLQEALKQGAIDFIQKPMDEDKLLSMLEKFKGR